MRNRKALHIAIPTTRPLTIKGKDKRETVSECKGNSCKTVSQKTLPPSLPLWPEKITHNKLLCFSGFRHLAMTIVKGERKEESQKEDVRKAPAQVARSLRAM